MWQSQVENEHYSTLSVLIQLFVVDTGRKRTLFHCKWANSISYISLECFIEIAPDFLCPFMNA